MDSLSVLAVTTIVVVSVKASLDTAIIRHEFLDFREIPDHAYSWVGAIVELHMTQKDDFFICASSQIKLNLHPLKLLFAKSSLVRHPSFICALKTFSPIFSIFSDVHIVSIQQLFALS